MPEDRRVSSAGPEPAHGEQRLPRWLAMLFWLVVIQLPFEMPGSILPFPGQVVTHLEITLAALLVGYLSWRIRSGFGSWPIRGRGSNGRPGPESSTLSSRRPTLDIRRLWRRPETWIVVWIATLVLSAAFAPDLHTVSLKFILRSIAISAFFWVARDLHRGSLGNTDATLARLLALLAGVVAGLGLLESQAGSLIEPFLRQFRPIQTFDDGVGRLTSTFSHANQTAAWLAMSLPVVIGLGLRASRAWIGYAALLGFLAWALASTLGRGGILAGLLVGSIALLVVLRRPSDRRRALVMSVALLGVSAAYLALSPGLQKRFGVEQDRPAYSATYECPSRLTLVPGDRTTIQVSITNRGFEGWTDRDPYPVNLSYHVYNLGEIGGGPVDGVRTPLPQSCPPGQTTTLDAVFAVPPDPGLYLVAWDLVRENVLWFTWHDVIPGLTLLWVDRAGSGHLAPSPWSEEWYDGMPAPERLAWLDQLAKRQPASALGTSKADSTGLDPGKVPRTLLWNTARDLFRERPLTGWGPDTFRYRCSARMALSRENTDLQAHNLYLELLATAGILSLAAWLGFLTMMMGAAVPEARQVPDPARARLIWGWFGLVTVFSVHGLVDSFFGSYELMGLFWIGSGSLVGTLQRGKRDREGVNHVP